MRLRFVVTVAADPADADDLLATDAEYRAYVVEAFAPLAVDVTYTGWYPRPEAPTGGQR